MTVIALVVGYAVMCAGGVAALAWAWLKALDLCYRNVIHTREFFDVLVRYKREQRASKELAEVRKSETFMGRPE